MEEVLERCCGLDVHRDTIVACIIEGSGKQLKKEIKTFGTMSDDIEDLGKWLTQNKIKHLAIESTGVYWKPIFNILEKDFEIILANARHVKNVPGRKTDVKDSEWLCKLLKNGLIERSFIPQETIRHLRDLTRYRRALTQDVTGAKNRLIKTLESANIKLSSVFTDVFGKTAWNIIQMIVNGEKSVERLTEHIPGQVKMPKETIKKALKGTLKEHHLIMLKMMMSHIVDLETLIESVESQIITQLKPYEVEVNLLKTIPGVSDTAAAIIIAEIGVDMNQFPSSQHLASWAGLSPSNNESAGKKKALE